MAEGTSRGGTFGRRMRSGRILGSACLLGGLLVSVSGLLLASQVADGVTLDTALARFANGLFGLAVLGLMGGVLGLYFLRVGGAGWLPVTGAVVTLAGLLFWMIGGLILTADASAGDRFFAPVGGILSSAGMIAYGIATIRARVLGDWRRLTPLLVGVWFFVQLPVQLVFFVGVRGFPSYTILLGIIGMLWAAVGYTVGSFTSESVPKVN